MSPSARSACGNLRACISLWGGGVEGAEEDEGEEAEEEEGEEAEEEEVEEIEEKEREEAEDEEGGWT